MFSPIPNIICSKPAESFSVFLDLLEELDMLYIDLRLCRNHLDEDTPLTYTRGTGRKYFDIACRFMPDEEVRKDLNQGKVLTVAEKCDYVNYLGDKVDRIFRLLLLSYRLNRKDFNSLDFVQNLHSPANGGVLLQVTDMNRCKRYKVGLGDYPMFHSEDEDLYKDHRHYPNAEPESMYDY